MISAVGAVYVSSVVGFFFVLLVFSLATFYPQLSLCTMAAVQADLNELEVQFQRVLLRHPGPVFIKGYLNC